MILSSLSLSPELTLTLHVIPSPCIMPEPRHLNQQSLKLAMSSSDEK